MKLVMTLLVRNEEDIISLNIDFHRRMGVDHFVAIDNRSNDETTEILRGYEKLGILDYVWEADDNYDQWRWVTAAARRAYERHGADWVIDNDADEFWYPNEGTLKDALATVPRERRSATAQRSNFVARPLNGKPFWSVMTAREKNSVGWSGNPLPGKMCHRGAADITVHQGNHGVAFGDVLETAPAAAPITILHFPMRTYKQFATKIALGGAAYARNAVLPPNLGRQWRDLYEVFGRGELLAYFNTQVRDDASVARGLADGTLIEDRRLADLGERLIQDGLARRPMPSTREAIPMSAWFRHWRGD